MTSREAFLAVLFNGPLMRGDAVVVLCGEDAEPRAGVALEMFRQQAAPLIVLSGGIDNAPRWQGAASLQRLLIGKGVAPKAIRVENESTNTREQAVGFADMARAEGWQQVLLVASPYHTPRAFLTFLKALQEAGLDGTVRLVPVPASQSKWYDKPEGVESTRVGLLAGELAKVEQYAEHVASYEDGLDYLEHWEGR